MSQTEKRKSREGLEEEQAVGLLREATKTIEWEREDEEGSIDRLGEEGEGELAEKDDEAVLTANANTPDAIIKRTCIRVALASFASSGPGLGTLAAFTLGMAATTGITLKLQSDMINEIGDFYGHELSTDSRQRVLLLLSGLSQGTSNISTEAAKAAATSAVSVVASKVANKTTSSILLKGVPVIGPLTSASMAVSTTYIIGQRAKVYFSQGEEALSSWSESVRAVSGVDERRMIKWIIEAWALMRESLSTKLQSGKSAIGSTLKSMSSTAASAGKAITKRLSFRRKVVNKTEGKNSGSEEPSTDQ